MEAQRQRSRIYMPWWGTESHPISLSYLSHLIVSNPFSVSVVTRLKNKGSIRIFHSKWKNEDLNVDLPDCKAYFFIPTYVIEILYRYLIFTLQIAVCQWWNKVWTSRWQWRQILLTLIISIIASREIEAEEKINSSHFSTFSVPQIGENLNVWTMQFLSCQRVNKSSLLIMKRTSSLFPTVLFCKMTCTVQLKPLSDWEEQQTFQRLYLITKHY